MQNKNYLSCNNPDELTVIDLSLIKFSADSFPTFFKTQLILKKFNENEILSPA